MDENTFYLLLGVLPTIFGALSFLMGKLIYTYSYMKEERREVYFIGGIISFLMIFLPFGMGFLAFYPIPHFCNNDCTLLKFLFILIGLSIAITIINSSSPILKEKKEMKKIFMQNGFEYGQKEDMKLLIYISMVAVYIFSDMWFSGYSLRTEDYPFLIHTIFLGMVFIFIFPLLVSAYSAYYPRINIHLENGESIDGFLIKIGDTFMDVLYVAGYKNNEVDAYLTQNNIKKRNEQTLIPAHYFININHIDYFLIPEKTDYIRRQEYMAKHFKNRVSKKDEIDGGMK